MSLNLKNPKAHELARELAQITGESMSAAVITALREQRDRLIADRHGGLSQRLIDIGKDCADHLPEHVRTLDHGDLLYDKDGLPG